MGDENYTNVLLEEMNSKFDKLIEIVGQLSDELKKKANQSDLDEVKSDVKTVKSAVTETTIELANIGNRVRQLETA